MSERDFADAFDRWLRAEGFVFRRDRMDKATTGQVGWPDFTIIAQNRVLLIELKTEKGILSRDQQNMQKRLVDTGTHVHVCRRIEDAVLLVQEWRASLPPLSTPSPENKTPATPRQESPLRLLNWCGQTWTVTQDSTHGRNGWSLLHKATPEELATLKPI